MTTTTDDGLPRATERNEPRHAGDHFDNFNRAIGELAELPWIPEPVELGRFAAVLDFGNGGSVCVESDGASDRMHITTRACGATANEVAEPNELWLLLHEAVAVARAGAAARQ